MRGKIIKTPHPSPLPQGARGKDKKLWYN